MLKSDIDNLISDINELKTISDKQEYVVSAKMNTIYNKMMPILQKESKRLELNNIEIDSPRILIISYDKSMYFGSGNLAQGFTEQINEQLQDLVMAEYKIIDFGLINNEYAFIKYTN